MTPLRQLPGFLAGLVIILVAGVGLHLFGRLLAGDDPTARMVLLVVTFMLSVVAFVFLERKFWLSRLMGLRHGRIPILEAAMFALLSIVWAFVRAAGAESEEEAAKAKAAVHPRDAGRESVETVVFVVVLVLLLKLFVTEAFVIPTGSMAETLYGYQKIVTCPHCSHEFPVNSHDEVEPGQDGEMRWLVGYTCPNCRYTGQFKPIIKKDDQGFERLVGYDSPPNRTGDRVLVLKPLYHVTNPARGDVVVFKYPKEPQTKHTAQNYIKRCMGFGGETLGIHRGELFVTRSLSYPTPDPADAPLNLWRPHYMYADSFEAQQLFTASRSAGFPGGVVGFEIVQKIDEHVLACRRVVWDNDKQPAALAGKVPPRWFAPEANSWTGDSAEQPKAFAHKDAAEHWIRYRHLVWVDNKARAGSSTLQDTDAATGNRVWEEWTWEAANAAPPAAGPIDNFLGYNAGLEVPKSNPRGGKAFAIHTGGEYNWVGDLILECEAEIGDGGEVTLELSKGVNRFQAHFANGTVTLSRTGPGGGTLGSRPCRVKPGGKYVIRFANVDCRLRVWVDNHLIGFGDDGNYPHPTPAETGDKRPEGWTWENDVEAPASIGAKGNVAVRHLRLDRDIFYTRKGTGDHTGADTYYVQPGHYMCMGDNSAQSSDSRTWGVVPERLMLGKAVFVFWPAFPDNRIGFIK